MKLEKIWIRATVYMLVGLSLALGGFLSDIIIEDYLNLPHAVVLIYAIPVFMVVAIILARRDTERSQRSRRLEKASRKMADLMTAAIMNKGRTPEFEESGLPTCWEQLGCDKTDCPVYGKEHTRCWLVAGTFCRGEVQGQFANKLKNCRECEVYKTAAPDPVSDIEEHFWGMMYVLKEREDELEKLYSQSESHGNRLKALLTVSQRALSTLEPDELLEPALEYLADMGADFSACFLLQEDGETLKPAATHGFGPGAEEGLTMKVGENIAGMAFAENRIVAAEDLPNDPRLINRFIRSHKPVTVIAIPLTCHDKQLGVLTMGTLTAHHYSDNEQRVLQIAADQIAMAIDNASLFEETRRMATTDGLTSLANHRTFYNTLEREMDRASRYGRPLSLLMVDIDNFKQFNDTYGHVQGDRVLAEVGAILTGSVRNVDLAARYGGEEFAVILPETACMTSAGERDCSALQVAERIRDAVASHRFEVENGDDPLGITVSVGVSEFPVYASDLRSLVGTADDALYLAKNGGRNRVVVAGKQSGSATAALGEKAV